MTNPSQSSPADEPVPRAEGRTNGNNADPLGAVGCKKQESILMVKLTGCPVVGSCFVYGEGSPKWQISSQKMAKSSTSFLWN